MVGFRAFEMINNIMHINGKRIVFKGVNRHEFRCYKGRYVSKEEMLWDVKTMKWNNINIQIKAISMNYVMSMDFMLLMKLT